MKNEKVHSILLALVGGYILYLAYELFEKYRNGTEEMPEVVYILTIAVFSIAGICIFIFAWKTYKKSQKEDKQDG